MISDNFFQETELDAAKVRFNKSYIHNPHYYYQCIATSNKGITTSSKKLYCK